MNPDSIADLDLGLIRDLILDLKLPIWTDVSLLSRASDMILGIYGTSPP